MSGGINVSRETEERLVQFSDLVLKWNNRINLIGRGTISDIWQRHILDSVQIVELAPSSVPHWLDLGSGGGFPGLVVAIVALETGSPERVTLVESDARKGAFLRAAIRDLRLNAEVKTARIEKLPPQSASVLSARALADLTSLCAFADQHLAPDGICLFPKGESWGKEVEDAQKTWSFSCDPRTSKTSPKSVILKISGVRRV